VHLPIHERSLIALNKILNLVEAVQKFDEKVMIEHMINQVIPLEHFQEIQTLLITHLLHNQGNTPNDTPANVEEDVIVQQLSIQLFHLAQHVEETFNNIVASHSERSQK
jgi:hypothetical protein